MIPFPPVSCTQANAEYRTGRVFILKKEIQKNLIVAGCFLGAFILWTLLLRFVDVQPIGPQGSAVGFATINGFVHSLTGVHMKLYTLTDWLGLVPLLTAAGFALLGLAQWIRRKRLLKVDFSILVLGGFYLATAAAFLFFEGFVVNYRPVLIGGVLEASYPSSTTLLTMCVMPTAMQQLRCRIKNTALRTIVLCLTGAFTAFMVIGRLISGVHWITDIIGGALLSAGLVKLYRAVSNLK